MKTASSILRTFLSLALIFVTAEARSAAENPAGGAAGIVFIVNSRNPVTSAGVKDLVDYYEKKRRQWPDGAAVRFVDQGPGSPERARFIKDILGLSESDVDFYWFAEKLRSGYSAPIQVSSDTLVIEMVKTFAGAIGYVSPRTSLSGTGVKPIQVPGLEPK